MGGRCRTYAQARKWLFYIVFVEMGSGNYRKYAGRSRTVTPTFIMEIICVV